MLKKRQMRFIDEFCVDYNQTKAAIRAGYKESNAASQASRLMKNPEVLTAIAEKQKELLESTCLSEEKVICQLQEVLNQCMAATPVMSWDYEEHCYAETGEYQFDSKGALKAIELLGKHLGMFNKDRNERDIQVKDDGFIEALTAKAGELNWEE